MNPVRTMALRRHVRAAILALKNNDVEQAKYWLELIRQDVKA
jgi:hypothetical protein